MKFSGSLSDVNIENPAKYFEVMPRSCISKNHVFRDFGLSFTDQMSYVKNSLNFVRTYIYQYLVKMS